MATNRVTGHLLLRERRQGPVWYLHYRLADKRQVQRKLGPAWTEKGRPADGYFTRKMAEAALRAVVVDAERGTLAGSQPRSGRTFEDACAEWLRYVEAEKQRRPSTVRDYRNTVNGVLLPEFGKDTPLERITTERIEEWRERLLDEGKLSRRTIQKYLVILHGILERAKRRKWIASNPASDVERVTVRRDDDFNVLSPDEVMALARVAVSEQDAVIFVVAAYTGLRLGELRALRWDDLDFANRIVFVRRSLTNGHEGPPKSGKVRSVPLADQAARALDGLSRRPMFVAPGDRVFCSEVGAPVHDDQLRDRFYDALAAAGLGHKREGSRPMVFHDLRHTFGTLAVGRASVVEVKEWMGHANVATTEIYLHYQPKQESAAKLTEAFATSSGPAETVYPTVYRTAENGAELSATESVESPVNT